LKSGFIYLTTLKMSFVRKSGRRDVREFASDATFAVGDACSGDEAGQIAAAATSKPVLGIVVEAGTNASTLSVDILQPGDLVEATIETGTMAAGEILNEADINSQDGLTLTESNNDFIILGWDGSTTTKCFGYFTRTTTGAGVHAA